MLCYHSNNTTQTMNNADLESSSRMTIQEFLFEVTNSLLVVSCRKYQQIQGHIHMWRYSHPMMYVTLEQMETFEYQILEFVQDWYLVTHCKE